MCKPIYANSLTVTANEAKNEFVFTFKHKYPVVGANGVVERPGRNGSCGDCE